MSRVNLSRLHVEPLEKRELLSLVIDLKTTSGGKTAAVNTVGQVVNFDIWATASGANATGSDEQLQIAVGSLLSTNVNGGAVNGTLKATLTSPFNALGSQLGKQVDLDGDGDLDVGSNNNGSATNFVFARAESLQGNGTVSGNKKTFKIGTATFTVTSLKSSTGQTNVNWRGRDYSSGALWREDNSLILKNGDTGAYLSAAPVVLTRGSSPPPPPPGTGAISGKVFKDTDKDGVKDTAEAGHSGVVMFIDADKDGVKDTGEKTATTNSSGDYSFGSLGAGSYRVREVVPTGYKVGNPSVGYFDVTLTTGQKVTGKNFANQVTTTTLGSIAGQVRTDTDGDGSLETGEAGKSGVVVYIDTDKDGVKDTGEKSATTDASGNYKFSSLAAGTYRVRIQNPSGFRLSTPTSGYQNVTVSGNNITGKNFGVTQRVLITGRLWVDSDKDGVKDSAESVLSGWTVFIDKDKDGIFDAGENNVKTDSSGNYSFKSLTAGSYRVRVVQQSGHTRIAPSSGYYDLNSLGNGSIQKDKNFRYTKP